VLRLLLQVFPFWKQNARVDRRILLYNGRAASDYAGGSAGRTVGSRRVAAWTNRSTKSTRAFATRSGANAPITGRAFPSPVGLIGLLKADFYMDLILFTGFANIGILDK